MRPLLAAWAAWAVLSFAGIAAEPRRQAVPIGGEWNLSGETLEKTKPDGKRTSRILAKGSPRLKKGRNQFVGPWYLEATAVEIECDFPGKRFILKGPLEIRKKEPAGGGQVIEADTAETTVELAFQGDGTKVAGPHRTKLLDPKNDEAPPKK